MKYLFTAIILLSLGCGQNSKNPNAAKSTADTAKKAPDMVKADTTGEYIDWYKVKLNGTLPMLSSFKASVKALGKPDSVVTPKYEDVSVSFFNGSNFKYVYYKGLEFETENDSLVFNRIDFSKNPKLFLTTDKIKLGPATTVNEFKKLFPKSADEALHGSDMDKYTSFRLNVAKGNTDDAWILEFDAPDGKLVSVTYYMPD